MKRGLLWALAVVITLASAVYQRMTGPTYPLQGKAAVEGYEISYKLPRSAETGADCEIGLSVPAPDIDGYLIYKRFKTADAWRQVPLERRGGRLSGYLPGQPAAGKLAYRVFLVAKTAEYALGGETPLIIRFKGPVPAGLLLPHVLIMFLAMLFSTRAGIAALDRKGSPGGLARWTALLLFAGGFVLGPLIQKAAFGVFWSGLPLGTDLTDNKTLVSMLFWAAALIAGRKGRAARGWVLAASVVTLLIYIIPHSLFGSELDWSRMG